MAATYPQIVLLGDSLFQGSVHCAGGFSLHAALQDRYLRRLDVINRGFSGWNSTYALRFLPDMFPERTETSPKLDYLIILLGANDAVKPLPTTQQHTPLEKYKENLVKIITHPRITAHKPKILLVTPPPLDEVKTTKRDLDWGHPEPCREAAISASYSEKCREIARENPDVVLIDLWKAIMDKAISMAPDDYKQGGPWLGTHENGKQGGLDTLLHDGLHLSTEAYKVFFEAIVPHVGQQWVGLAAEDRSDYVLPDWRDLK